METDIRGAKKWKKVGMNKENNIIEGEGLMGGDGKKARKGRHTFHPFDSLG